ncbi:hypothetical protein ACFE04_005218 [Oxalis oulophora]
MNCLLITCKDTAVLDVLGKPLLTTNSYYLKTVFLDLVTSPRIDLTSDGHIIERLKSGGARIPVGLIPKVTGIVNESSSLLIQFNNHFNVKSYQWKVDNKDEKTGNYYLSVDMGGKKGKDNVWFQIVKSNERKYSYNIMCCLGKTCYPVSVYIVNGEHRLAVNDRENHIPLNFEFVKA